MSVDRGEVGKCESEYDEYADMVSEKRLLTAKRQAKEVMIWTLKTKEC